MGYAPHITLAVIIASLFVLLPVSAAHAQTPSVQSEWLEPRRGYEESALGARIDSILEDEDMTAIHISLPTPELPIEEVVVVGKRPDRFPPVKQEKPVKIINDLETGRSGIVIYLGKRQGFMLRINYQEGYRHLPGIE